MTEETNCYECDTPLTTICPQCNALSAAPSPDPSEDVVAEALQLAAIVWSGKPHPKEPYWRFLASAIVTMFPTLSEEDRARVEEVRGRANTFSGRFWEVGPQTRVAMIDRIVQDRAFLLSLIDKLAGEL